MGIRLSMDGACQEQHLLRLLSVACSRQFSYACRLLEQRLKRLGNLKRVLAPDPAEDVNQSKRKAFGRILNTQATTSIIVLTT